MSEPRTTHPKAITVVVFFVALLAVGLAALTFRFDETPLVVGPLLLALLGMVLHFLPGAQDLSRYGFINVAFFLAVVSALGPSSALPLKPGLAPALVAAGRWACGAFTLLLSLLPTLMMPFGSGYAGVNALRWLIVGGVACGLGALSPTWGLPLGTLAGAAAYAVIDAALVTGWGPDGDPDSDRERRKWDNVLKPSSLWILALPVVVGGLAAGLATGLSALEVTSNGGAASGVPWLSLVTSGILAAPLTAFLGFGLRASLDEIDLQDQEQLELKVKALEHESTRNREKQENVQEDVKRQQEELKVIYELARSLGASTNLSETTNLVASMIRRLRIPYQSCVIFLVKPGGGLEPALAETPYKEVLGMSGLLQLQEPFILQVLRDPRPYMNNEVSASTSEQRIFKDERSLLIVPLMVSKENVGIIYIGSVHAKTHKEEHLEKLKMLAAFAAPSVKTATLFEHKEKDLQSERQIREAVEAKNHQLNGLQKMGQAIGASLKIENTFKVVAENLLQMVPGAQSVILFGLNGKEDHVLKAEFINSPYTEYVRSLAVRNDEGILGKATEMNRTLLVSDTEQYDLQNLIHNERTVIVAPLRAEEEILGCLYLGGAREGAFTEEQRSLVETVSYQASIAVKNARLYEQTQQMAFTDGLTGLYLHRFFQVRLTEELAWADRTKKSICLVMVDTDHFKTFNDTLGHPAGDALLQEIAALLKDKVRSTDIVCRYGGDEFALILKDLPKEESVRICERIRETFQLRFAGSAVQVTSSIGLACYPSDAINKKELAKAADDAMYVSKKTGRNKVTAAPTLEEKKYIKEDDKVELIPR